MPVYRLILTLATPLLLVLLLWRALRGRETLADGAQRLGGGTGRPGALWIHGASNGELASARALIEDLLARHPEAHLVVTANTVTGRDLVAGWALPRTRPRLAPLDLRPVLARFRRQWRPKLLIVLENELWPNRLLTAGSPVAAIGARMSGRSARRWARFPRLAARILSRIDLLCPQDTASARRFRALGLPAGHLGPTGTLKAAPSLAAPDPQDLDRLRKVFRRADTLLAASTHPGEEEIVLDAFCVARRSRPGLRLILAPRHPARGDAVARAIAATGLAAARRSTGEAPGPATAVYLADTLGEMALWYSLAGVTFVGGSLAPHGGHTPYEPAHSGSALLHGPDTANFADPYNALDASGGAIRVDGAVSLAAALAELASPETQARQVARAEAVLADSGPGAILDEILVRLDTLLTGPRA